MLLAKNCWLMPVAMRTNTSKAFENVNDYLAAFCLQKSREQSDAPERRRSSNCQLKVSRRRPVIDNVMQARVTQIAGKPERRSRQEVVGWMTVSLMTSHG